MPDNGAMTDAEFVMEFRRGLIICLGAFVRRFGLAWTDFLPKHVTAPPTYAPATVTPAPEYR
jgi:hypothetical protein